MENNKLIQENIIEQCYSSANLLFEDRNSLSKIKSNFSKKSLDSRNTLSKKLENFSNLAYSFLTKSIYYSDNNLIQIDKTYSEYPFEIVSLRNNFNEENKNNSYNLDLSFSHDCRNGFNTNIVFFSCNINCSKCNNEMNFKGDNLNDKDDNIQNNANSDLKNIILCEECQLQVD